MQDSSQALTVGRRSVLAHRQVAFPNPSSRWLSTTSANYLIAIITLNRPRSGQRHHNRDGGAADRDSRDDRRADRGPGGNPDGSRGSGLFGWQRPATTQDDDRRTGCGSVKTSTERSYTVRHLRKPILRCRERYCLRGWLRIGTEYRLHYCL